MYSAAQVPLMSNTNLLAKSLGPTIDYVWQLSASDLLHQACAACLEHAGNLFASIDLPLTTVRSSRI